MGKKNRPRRGSLGFSPRKRASRIYPRVSSYPEVKEKIGLLGFVGYKAGCSHVIIVDDRETSPTYMKEIFSAVTIIETPPLYVCGVRAYVNENGLKSKFEVWSNKLPPHINRKVPNLKIKDSKKHNMDRIKENIDEIRELRVICCTQPKIAGISKKKPEILEIKIGGSEIGEIVDYAEKLLGNEVKVQDVFKDGQYIDVIGVTKGKGFQGVVKRWGVHLLSHKARKRRREVGSLGSWHPAKVLWTVPRPGQTGFHRRTEYNKRILRIGEAGVLKFDGVEQSVTPKGGFPHYGVVKSDFVIVQGSVPGPSKRLIFLRHPIRLLKPQPEKGPKIIFYKS